ncbi:Abnormal cell migration protein [Echinococcus granulosus]|uniref:Abnormal cell migration protein n=1 Tax=Echinococcus granulosus TaxID=6210 RepID=W6UWF9_ECHGR|nr:Abnormal cell migration protein [Echinococcus granulosus]EUB64951.1 Abnormal cell migration protein [Echinococcus granulosus]
MAAKYAGSEETVTTNSNLRASALLFDSRCNINYGTGCNHGLERKCPSTPSNRLPPSSSSEFSYSDPRHLARSPPHPPSSWQVAQILDSPSGLPPQHDAHLSTPPSPPSLAVPAEEGQDASASIANTLTQSIRASFNPLSCRALLSAPINHSVDRPIHHHRTRVRGLALCDSPVSSQSSWTGLPAVWRLVDGARHRAEMSRPLLIAAEATAENDLNCLLRQLEEVESTMKQLEQDDGGFTRRYSLASSSTTDPNTGCNPSPAPDAPEQVTPPPLFPLATNGHGHTNNAEQRSAETAVRRPALVPRSLPLRSPSPSNTDYELADEASVAFLLAPSIVTSTKITHMGPHDGDLIDEAPPVAVPSNEAQSSRLSSFDSTPVRRSSLAALRPPLPPPLSQNPLATSLATTCSSNEASFSDKSVSEFPELSNTLSQVVDLADRLQLNKLVVRIFRPDRTTKAILIDQRMAAGEIASMLIEKNFLEPCVKLCLVEKVPSLKVERVFEESDIVAECILAWPIKSQNMIFFESRDDHFGFIESPKDWLGETYADAHGFHSSDSVQTMLENFTSSGLAEWHDFLYIRKPGEKTWTRRMCVLRNSGLYATKKNKKAFLVSDLVRLLALDDKLHIYTTTGGWSRMRAPTPHGFALKTYAAQDFSSSHVFCFCAPDENALKQWACRLRLAKYGISLLRDYQIAKERVSRCLSGDPQTQKTVAEIKQLTRQSSVEWARSSSLQALQPPLPRPQAPGVNLNPVNQVTTARTMTPPPLVQQRITPRTPKSTTTLRRPPDLLFRNGYVKHHSTGAPSQHFYIR